MNNNEKLNIQVCEIPRAVPVGMVIFGASGDLTYKKLIPSLFGLYKKGSITKNFFILGVARTDYDDSSFRKRVEQSINQFFNNENTKLIHDFCLNCYYIKGDYENDATYITIYQRIIELALCYKTQGNIIYNLAVPPSLFSVIVKKLGENKLIEKGKNKEPFQRLLIEKPFGLDFQSADELNKIILKYADDEQIFRIDHYLGKSTVQNILVFRFANPIFERVWNRDCIDSIQIKFAETEGVENRGGYFEQTGLLRDVFQNHILQLIALIAIEKPEIFKAEKIQEQKIKLFKSLKPLKEKILNEYLVRGQYKEAEINGQKVIGYREEKDVNKKSCVETFFVMKLFIDNNRWKNVPFYIMAGKRLNITETKINVVFKKNLKCIFCDKNNETQKNLITFNIKPEQGVSLRFVAKVPGAKMCVAPLYMKFNYKDIFGYEIIDDYESVILDCILGDQTIFWKKEAIDLAWKFLDPVLKKWNSCSLEEKNKFLHFYPALSSGPQSAFEFIRKDGREWF